jgi:tRNA/rRNA methyltransferase
MQPTQQDIQTVHGIVVALTEGRKGPARGGVLDSEEATALRALLAEYADARAPGERGPVRGLARLLRRNPTDAERVLWDGLTKDRRFAGQGFKRQIPVAPSPISCRTAARGDRPRAGAENDTRHGAPDRRARLGERGYRVLAVGRPRSRATCRGADRRRYR